jgi:hypothetical protein
MTDKQYQVAEFETDSSSWNFKEDYNVLDEMVGANLARNIKKSLKIGIGDLAEVNN